MRTLKTAAPISAKDQSQAKKNKSLPAAFAPKNIEQRRQGHIIFL